MTLSVEERAERQREAKRKYGEKRKKKERLRDGNATVVILPDTQTKSGVPVDHIEWINRYVRDRYEGKPLTFVMLGDWWDMPSLSSYDVGRGSMEGRRVMDDIDAGNRAFAMLNKDLSWPGLRKVFLFGNHEDRISRAIESDIQLEGMLSLDLCDTQDWERHEFRAPVNIHGVVMAHYFYAVNTGRPLGGENLETRLKTIGHSFVAGHQPGLKVAMRYVGGRQQIGIQAGSAYLHEEKYLGPQGNHFWRGVVVLNNVNEGSADIMTVSLDYLARRYAGVPLADFKPKVIL